MIVQALFKYIFVKEFLYQITATLTVYAAVRFAIFLRRRYIKYQTYAKLGIPHPEPSLFQGNIGLFLKRQDAYRVSEGLKQKYGRYWGLYIGDEMSMVITDLDILKQIFFEKTQSFKERTYIFMHTPLVKGILFARYERWRQMRKIMSPSFSRYTVRGGKLTQFIEDAIKLTLEYIDSRLERNDKGRLVANIDIQDLMKSSALYMISKMAVKLPGVKVCEGEEHVKALDAYLSGASRGVVIWAIRFPFIIPILQVLALVFERAKTLTTIRRELKQEIDAQFKKMAAQNRAVDVEKSDQHQQVIDILIRLHFEGKMTREEVLSNACALLFAGYDTTSTTLAYIFWVLAKYPEIQDKLRSDLIAHGIESHYLEQVINETMRLYPTVFAFTTRVATETVTINELTIPKGVKVTHSTWLMHRDPELWPDPEKFDPERFRPGHPEYHPCAFAPFGLGERRCLGFQLAMLEMKMLACDIVLRYKLHLKAPVDLYLINYAAVLSKPKEPIMIELEKL